MMPRIAATRGMGSNALLHDYAPARRGFRSASPAKCRNCSASILSGISSFP
jgi:hypothetical protein